MPAGVLANLTKGPWLLWIGVGLNASLASMGSHWLWGQGLQLICFSVWAAANADIKKVISSTLFVVVDIFFKDFDVAGLSKVPEGPVIFACAPHTNQFLDGICVARALKEHRRDLGFLTAAVTMRKPFIGMMAKNMNSIPVERPQDLAVTGTGLVNLVSNSVTLTGTGTKFTTELKKKYIVTITSGPFKGAKAKVVSVSSDTKATLDKPMTEEKVVQSDQTAPFKVTPHLDQSSVFDAVHERLRKGGAVGIFPEGGSHDRTQLLPLKAGVTFMALGAMASHQGLQVPIVPIGLNYFQGHRFRSRVFIEIGDPIIPTTRQVQDYKQGGAQKRKACGDLLNTVVQGMGAVTVQAQNFDTLQFFRAMRRLYWNEPRHMTPEERFGLTGAFAKGYEDVKDEPEVKDLYVQIQKYRSLLKSYSVSDYRVHKVNMLGDRGDRTLEMDTFLATRTVVMLLIYRLFVLMLYVTLALPGIILAMPFFLVSRTVSAQKAKAAAERSSVKIAGRDLLATWKVLVSLVGIPLLHIIYTCIVCLWMGRTEAIIFFFFMPFVSLLAVKSTENAVKILQSIKTLWIAVVDPESGYKLLATRRQLKDEVLKVVKKFQWDRSIKNSASLAYLFRRELGENTDDDKTDTED